MKPVIAITMGDPGGIGPEVILKTLQNLKLNRNIHLLLIGSRSVFDFVSKSIHIKLPQFNTVSSFEPALLRTDSVNFLDISNETKKLLKKGKDHKFEIGKVSLKNGALAFAAIQAAAQEAKRGLIQAIVTAPIHKEAIRLVEPGFSGHTEYLAKIAGTKDFAMFFYSNLFCVTLATIHVPLKKVSAKLNVSDLVIKLKLTNQFLKSRLNISEPKIAVCALNPHGKEFGDEEEKIILPAVRRAQKLGIGAEGPLPGDQVFFDAYKKKFHAVLAMYHDQGLAPFKMIAFEDGVNITLGLPYLRTSPDHGTAYDIANQNKANPASFRSALSFAINHL